MGRRSSTGCTMTRGTFRRTLSQTSSADCMTTFEYTILLLSTDFVRSSRRCLGYGIRRYTVYMLKMRRRVKRHWRIWSRERAMGIVRCVRERRWRQARVSLSKRRRTIIRTQCADGTRLDGRSCHRRCCSGSSFVLRRSPGSRRCRSSRSRRKMYSIAEKK